MKIIASFVVLCFQKEVDYNILVGGLLGFDFWFWSMEQKDLQMKLHLVILLKTVN